MPSTTRQKLTINGVSVGDTVALMLGRQEFVGVYGGKVFTRKRWRVLLTDDEGAIHQIPVTLIDHVVLLRTSEERAVADEWPILDAVEPPLPQSDAAVLRATWPIILLCVAAWLAAAAVAWWIYWR